MTEFTGERVIPGLVEQSLWDEHVSRYSFAAGLARGKRVLDVGCGAGYGTASLAETAEFALGFDISLETIEHATRNYGAKARFAVASAEMFPADNGSFNLITAFEVIEHLADWQRLLSEASRVLADGGLFLVSTPNKTYYGEARRQEGPNPFHVHEFEYAEFGEALSGWFPYVRILAQNRVEAFTFFGEQSPATGAATFVEAGPDVPSAHFYVAVCSRQPVPPMAYAYIPRGANLLWERERHIQLLNQQVDALSRERDTAAAQLVQFESDLNARTTWIAELEEQILDRQRQRDAAIAAVKTAEHELQERTDWVDRIQRELSERTAWAQSLKQELENAHTQVYELIAKLGDAEAVVIERTKWAQNLDRELALARTRAGELDSTLSERHTIISELTAEVTRGRNELGVLLGALRAQSAAADDHGHTIESPGLAHDQFADLRELVMELEKLRVSQARLFEIQMESRSELQRRLEMLMHERKLVGASRWLKLGRAIGLGPKIGE